MTNTTVQFEWLEHGDLRSCHITHPCTGEPVRMTAEQAKAVCHVYGKLFPKYDPQVVFLSDSEMVNMQTASDELVRWFTTGKRS